MSAKYTPFVQKAFKIIVHDVLAKVAEEGLTGGSHFYISFKTTDKDVVLPDFVRAKYPEQITIVLQHQFENLAVFDTFFSVDIFFGGVLSSLKVPFDSLLMFTDPSQDFVLVFKEDRAVKKEDKGTQLDTKELSDSAQVISFDNIRKKL